MDDGFYDTSHPHKNGGSLYYFLDLGEIACLFFFSNQSKAQKV